MSEDPLKYLQSAIDKLNQAYKIVLNNTVNDVTVKGNKSNGEDGGDDRVISINKLIPDIFRLIQNNRLLNTSKIKSSTKIRY